MSRTISYNVEIDVDEAIDLCVAERGLDYVISRLGQNDVLNEYKVYHVVQHFGEDEILSHISDSAIEEEFLSRQPLGRAMNE